jgi:hypothetical protein
LPDVQELEAANGAEPLEALRRAASRSHIVRTVALEPGGLVIGMFGVVAEDLEGLGRVWLMGSPEIASDRRWFWHQSKRQLQDLVVGYERVYNIVDDRYEAALRWLTRLGFRRVAGGPSAHSGLPLSVMELEVAGDDRSRASSRSGNHRHGDHGLRGDPQA